MPGLRISKFTRQQTWSTASGGRSGGLSPFRPGNKERRSRASREKIMEQISAYSERFNAELSRFENVENAHALPGIYHYWSGKYILPKLRALGFDSLVGFFVHYISESCNRRNGDITKIVSLGAGNSDFEVDLARRLRK